MASATPTRAKQLSEPVTPPRPSLIAKALADANTIKYWIVLFVLDRFFTLALGASYSSLNLLARGAITILSHCVVGFLIDLGGFFIGSAYYDPSLCIARGYNESAMLNDTLHSVGVDYGFNFYDGDYNKTPEQAQIDKFEYAIAQLGIQRGDRVIDIGCGCGDWLYYLQTKWDCRVVGINITPVQVSECKKRGLTVYLSDWKKIRENPELREKLYGQFDAVTFWDTVEHYVPMKYVQPSKIPQQNMIYLDMFKMAQRMLDPNGKNKIWISCLHMARKIWLVSLRKMFYVYLLDKMHSGFYPCNYVRPGEKHQTDQLVDNAKKLGVECTWRKDVTFDYYKTSVLSPTHFGKHHFKMDLPRFVFMASWILLDPHWWQRYLWFSCEVWMFQFDPEDIENSDVRLWWLVFENGKRV